MLTNQDAGPNIVSTLLDICPPAATGVWL